MTLKTHILLAAASILGLGALGACTAGTDDPTAAETLSAAQDTATTGAGSLSCAPDETQVAAGRGKAAGPGQGPHDGTPDDGASHDGAP